MAVFNSAYNNLFKNLSGSYNMETIVISGQPGAGSTKTAEVLSKRLSINFFTAGKLFKSVARGTIKDQYYYQLFKELCDKRNLKIPEFNESNDTHGASNLWDTEFGKSKDFHNAIDELQPKLAEQGRIVIEGKLALRMIKKANLKIWLKAPLSERAKRSAGRDNISLEEAERVLRSRQEKEREGWKKIYGFDYWDQEKEADLVIETSNISPEQIVEEIIKKLNQ